MNFSNILNDIVGTSNQNTGNSQLCNISKNIPGGLAGGAVAGGLVAMLVGSKSARKTAGKAAKYGGAALLGGLAYKAYKGWQANEVSHQHSSSNNHQFADNRGSSRTQLQEDFEREALTHSYGEVPVDFQLVLLKAMIAAARADGQIDDNERRKIYTALDQMDMNAGTKSSLLDLFLAPISINDFVHEVHTMEQKAEVYLASCLAIDLDHEAEYAYLKKLSNALGLPAGLEQQLRVQASNAISVAA